MVSNDVGTQESLEIAASQTVGQIVFSFSRLEFNLGLCLRNAVGSNQLELLNPLVERLSFKAKLDALLDVVKLSHSGSPDLVAEFKCWHQWADKIRANRNSFVHGRWGFIEHTSRVANVAPGMPGSTPSRETHYTLAELRAVLSDIEQMSTEFSRVRTSLGI
jgi:hypothetical protein